jgi:integrase
VTDLDVAKKTLRIERSVEETKAHGLRFKGPKREDHKRTIQIDDELLAILLAQVDKLERLVAGVPDGFDIDLSLIKLPTDAHLFPSLPGTGRKFTLARPRDPRNTSKEFKLKTVKLGFPGLRLHELRGSHETCLLDAGVPVHVVAKRCGHDPAVLLRFYAKRTRKAEMRSPRYRRVSSPELGTKFGIKIYCRPDSF